MTQYLKRSQRDEFTKIFEGIAKNLDITKTQFDNLVKSYNAVGEYLQNSPDFKDYDPVITPQGSLRLGTIIQPINEEDDLDVDLVYRLIGKEPTWTQKDIKDKVGNRLKSHSVYNEMLDEEGRRCWTLLYRKDSDNAKERYHMDILPCIANNLYAKNLANMSIRAFSKDDVQNLNIRITDKEMYNYADDNNSSHWLKSNPDGYALWFASRCKNNTESRENIMATIMPIGKYVANKSILQKVVQILKRHRDIMFQSDKEDKPISIIITTLAAKAYKGQNNLLEAYYDIVENMDNYIEKDENGNYIIRNPVNPEENFADKWPEHPKKKDNFFRWLRSLQECSTKIINSQRIEAREQIAVSFGKILCDKTFNDLVAKHIEDTNNKKLKIASTGVFSTIGKTLNANNTFYGKI